MATATLLSLNRATFMTSDPNNPNSLDYLSAKYKNIGQILPASQTLIITQKYVANPFGIAFDVYGNRDYWWLVCLFAGVLNPITDFINGMVIQLPSLSDLNALLNSQTTADLGANVTL